MESLSSESQDGMIGKNCLLLCGMAGSLGKIEEGVRKVMSYRDKKVSSTER